MNKEFLDKETFPRKVLPYPDEAEAVERVKKKSSQKYIKSQHSRTSLIIFLQSPLCNCKSTNVQVT